MIFAESSEDVNPGITSFTAFNQHKTNLGLWARGRTSITYVLKKALEFCTKC